MSAQQFDIINKAKHYNLHPSSVECVEIVECVSWNIGTAIKYVWRAGKKNDEIEEDLKKAAYYLKRAHARPVDRDRPPESLLDRVLEHEPDGSLLGDVLRALYVFTDGLSWYATVKAALSRVEREIEVRS